MSEINSCLNCKYLEHIEAIDVGNTPNESIAICAWSRHGALAKCIKKTIFKSMAPGILIRIDELSPFIDCDVWVLR